ncbi:MAG: hypothetical protein K0R38_6031 [Polyangiaceae bacterium]|jgi:hypothetical protein|nr:hypothetical protein [Polyangiaceae bacterium]
MFNRIAIASLCLVSLSSVACSKETTSSSNIKTGGIAALIDVYADNATTATVHVELKVGGSSSNAYVDLEGGDELTATAGDETKTLTARDTGIYEASFSGVGEDTEFSVTLERPDDVTATGNSGTLPAPFTLEEPTNELSRADDELVVAWDPDSRDDMRLELDGDCIFSFDKDVPDTGMYIIEAGTLDSTNDDDPEACDVDVDARRTRSGEADSKFDPESYFRLHQRRKTSFVSNP